MKNIFMSVGVVSLLKLLSTHAGFFIRGCEIALPDYGVVQCKMLEQEESVPMKSKNLLFGMYILIFVGILTVSGCTDDSSVTEKLSIKAEYVCPDGSIGDNLSSCSKPLPVRKIQCPSKEACLKECENMPKAIIIPTGVCQTGYVCEFNGKICNVRYVTQNIKQCTDIIQPESCLWDDVNKICN